MRAASVRAIIASLRAAAMAIATWRLARFATRHPTRLANRRGRRHLARRFTHRGCRPFAWQFAMHLGPGLRRRLLKFTHRG
jgi:hypothetical protein